LLLFNPNGTYIKKKSERLQWTVSKWRGDNKQLYTIYRYCDVSAKLYTIHFYFLFEQNSGTVEGETKKYIY